LRTLYGVVKGSSAHIRFFFMTGIARFSKVSLFSNLNNLIDLSLERDFHNLLGYTQQELETNFTAHPHFIAQERDISLAELLEQRLFMERQGNALQSVFHLAISFSKGI